MLEDIEQFLNTPVNHFEYNIPYVKSFKHFILYAETIGFKLKTPLLYLSLYQNIILS